MPQGLIGTYGRTVLQYSLVLKVQKLVENAKIE